MPKLPDLYDEPFGGQLRDTNFSRVATRAEAVTVSLSGDGGDELFGL